jgi:hypothetical protein
MALIRAHEVDLGANYGSTIGGAIERGQQMALNSQADQRAERSLGLMEGRDARQVEQLQKNETLMAQQQQQSAALAKQNQAEAQKLQTLTVRCAKGDRNACSMLPSDARLKVSKVQAQEFENRGVDSEFKKKDHADFSRSLQLKSHDGQTKSLQKRVQRLKEEGRDPTDTQSILDIDDPLQRNQVIGSYVSATENILALSEDERKQNEDERKQSKEVRDQAAYDAEVIASNNPQAVTDKSMEQSTEQKKNESFAKRMITSGGVAESQTDKTTGGRFDPTSRLDAAQDWFGTQEGRRIYDQGVKDWTAAWLRKESGAAISEEEWALGSTYWPRSGDTPKVVTMKKKQRELIQQNMINEAAPEGWYSKDKSGKRVLDPEKMPSFSVDGKQASSPAASSEVSPKVKSSKSPLTSEQVTSEVDALMAEF